MALQTIAKNTLALAIGISVVAGTNQFLNVFPSFLNDRSEEVMNKDASIEETTKYSSGKAGDDCKWTAITTGQQCFQNTVDSGFQPPSPHYIAMLGIQSFNFKHPIELEKCQQFQYLDGVEYQYQFANGHSQLIKWVCPVQLAS